MRELRIGVDELRRSIVVVVMDLKILFAHSEMKNYETLLNRKEYSLRVVENGDGVL